MLTLVKVYQPSEGLEKWLHSFKCMRVNLEQGLERGKAWGCGYLEGTLQTEGRAWSPPPPRVPGKSKGLRTWSVRDERDTCQQVGRQVRELAQELWLLIMRNKGNPWTASCPVWAVSPCSLAFLKWDPVLLSLIFKKSFYGKVSDYKVN